MSVTYVWRGVYPSHHPCKHLIYEATEHNNMADFISPVVETTLLNFTLIFPEVKVIWALSGFRAPDERSDHILHRDDPEPGHTTGLTVPGGGDAVSNL